MVQTPVKPLTLDEFLKQPETKPASEYGDGQITQKPMPQGKRSILQRELTFALTVDFKPDKIAQAFPELRCTFGGKSIVPDIAVFIADRIPRDQNGQVSNSFLCHPNWTIEILSPGRSQTKVLRNIFHCLEHGTAMGWLLDPEESCVFVSDSPQSVQMFEQPEMILPVPTFANRVQLTVGEIFGWLTE
ncbi:Uma2 family endonuclease [Okeania sp. SIO2G5]|uniref:Uma2 family endonuclease n=1 Tax=Okeania sp. SIO2G5 TaxID=2607796 RepID=UPI0013C13F87|nr:Uma2 family endonuclease [Okeania sp. SIO2G5]NEP76511.1 Uma2 family endonuclease [Okeania sp. SIO2G5]